MSILHRRRRQVGCQAQSWGIDSLSSTPGSPSVSCLSVSPSTSLYSDSMSHRLGVCYAQTCVGLRSGFGLRVDESVNSDAHQLLVSPTVESACPQLYQNLREISAFQVQDGESALGRNGLHLRGGHLVTPWAYAPVHPPNLSKRLPICRDGAIFPSKIKSLGTPCPGLLRLMGKCASLPIRVRSC